MVSSKHLVLIALLGLSSICHAINMESMIDEENAKCESGTDSMACVKVRAMRFLDTVMTKENFKVSFVNDINLNLWILKINKINYVFLSRSPMLRLNQMVIKLLHRLKVDPAVVTSLMLLKTISKVMTLPWTCLWLMPKSLSHPVIWITMN